MTTKTRKMTSKGGKQQCLCVLLLCGESGGAFCIFEAVWLFTMFIVQISQHNNYVNNKITSCWHASLTPTLTHLKKTQASQGIAL